MARTTRAAVTNSLYVKRKLIKEKKRGRVAKGKKKKDARSFGSAVHVAFGAFIKQTPSTWDSDRWCNRKAKVNRDATTSTSAGIGSLVELE